MTRSIELFWVFVTSCAVIPTGSEPRLKLPLPVRILYWSSGNWPVEKLNPATFTVTGPLAAREFTCSGALVGPPTPAKLKASPLAAAERDSVAKESWALAEASVTPKAAPPATVQTGEANVAGAVTISMPLLTEVAPEYNKLPENVSVPLPSLVKPPPPSSRA